MKSLFSRFIKLSRLGQPFRESNTLSRSVVDRHRKSGLTHDREPEDSTETEKLEAPRDYKYVMPEFLPDTLWYRRDRIREKLERQDMLNRRSVIDIPEFYVGSIMSVKVADPHSPTKTNKFVGICIHRGEQGLRANFTLRNIIDNQGVEVMYEMYSPTIHEIRVLKLEKRLDECLYYLRDAPPEYSTIPWDFRPVTLPAGVTVPVFTEKIPLNDPPWHERWERQELQGVKIPPITNRRLWKMEKRKEPWLEHDLMRKYRAQVTDEESDRIMDDVYTRKVNIDRAHKNRKFIVKKDQQ